MDFKEIQMLANQKTARIKRRVDGITFIFDPIVVISFILFDERHLATHEESDQKWKKTQKPSYQYALGKTNQIMTKKRRARMMKVAEDGPPLLSPHRQSPCSQ
jgi:hypothetical protein